MPVPFYDPFPKYPQIRNVLLRRLRRLQPGDRLPTEVQLAAEFQVSRVTMRQVLQMLTDDGIITRRPRLGTSLVVVPSPPLDDRLTGPVEEFAAHGTSTETRIAGSGIVTCPVDATVSLGLKPGSDCYELRRVRNLNGTPLGLLEAYFPVKIGHLIARRNLRGGLFVPALRELVDPAMREAYQQIDALTATREMARLLKIRQGDPILCVKRLFVDSAGRPLVFFRSNFRSDRYYYTVNLVQRRESKASPRAKPSSAQKRGR